MYTYQDDISACELEILFFSTIYDWIHSLIIRLVIYYDSAIHLTLNPPYFLGYKSLQSISRTSHEMHNKEGKDTYKSHRNISRIFRVYKCTVC